MKRAAKDSVEKFNEDYNPLVSSDMEDQHSHILMETLTGIILGAGQPWQKGPGEVLEEE